MSPIDGDRVVYKHSFKVDGGGDGVDGDDVDLFDSYCQPIRLHPQRALGPSCRPVQDIDLQGWNPAANRQSLCDTS